MAQALYRVQAWQGDLEFAENRARKGYPQSRTARCRVAWATRPFMAVKCHYLVIIVSM